MGTTKFDGLPRRRYDDLRPDIRTGDIFLASGNYSVSKMIQHVSGSMFSHVGFVFSWNSRVLVLESVEDDGVRAVPLRQYVRDYENTGEPYNGRLFLARHNAPLSPEHIASLLGEAADRLNRKYDKEEILKILARMTLRLGKHAENDAYICSEFVDECFRKLNVNFPRDEKGFIFPEHIAADVNVTAICEVVDQ